MHVDAQPWARIFIDNQEVGVTPMAKLIELREGSHRVRFEHDWYQPVERSIVIVGGSQENAQVLLLNFETTKAKLKTGKTVPP